MSNTKLFFIGLLKLITAMILFGILVIFIYLLPGQAPCLNSDPFKDKTSVRCPHHDHILTINDDSKEFFCVCNKGENK